MWFFTALAGAALLVVNTKLVHIVRYVTRGRPRPPPAAGHLLAQQVGAMCWLRACMSCPPRLPVLPAVVECPVPEEVLQVLL